MALPLVLAGPILRRVEPRLCTVWVALRESARVEVAVWEGAQFATADAGLVASHDPPIAVHVRDTRRFGEQLHVAVVGVPVLDSAPALLPNHSYSYDVQFTGAFGRSNLRDAGLLKDETSDARIPGVDPAAPLHLALGYLEDRLPSFTMAGATLDSLRMVHTSCRRPGAPLHDALAWLDKVIEVTQDDTLERPQQLYLTGDQIYADDVADVMLPMLNGLGQELVGGTELVPIIGKPVAGTMKNFPAARRTKLFRFEARFSSGSSSNHLITFGEYAAMYLSVWSSRMWRKLATLDEIFVPASPDTILDGQLTEWEKCGKYRAAAEKPDPLQNWRDAHGPGMTEEGLNTERFRASVPRVARALANVPTYMICDDHDITDDWNISQRWVNRVYSSPMGATVVRNGLLAYGIFQGWGNDPSAFDDPTKPTGQFLDEAVSVLRGPDVPTPPTVKLDELLGLSVRDADKQVAWNYQVPGPLHLTVVLDTRTKRTFRGQGHAPPNLLGDTLSKQLPDGPLPGGRRLLVVVSPAPVVGPQIIERLGQPVAAIMQDFKIAVEGSSEYDDCNPNGLVVGSERRDVEGWAANEQALESLLEKLAGYETVVILSGDVHFGASVELDYYKKPAVEVPGQPPVVKPPTRILQLIASPCHNTFHGTVQALSRTNALLQRVAGVPAVERIAWKKASPIVLPQGEPVPLARLVRMKREPALLLATGWPSGTTVPDDKGPDWGWRLTLVRDERPNGALPTALRQPFLPSTAELNVLSPLPGYRALAARHATAAMTHFDHLRTIVFNPHIGLVRIEADATGFVLVHALLSQDAPDSVLSSENTVHRMRLEPSARPAPALTVRDPLAEGAQPGGPNG
jgi:hypothetical protein